MSQLDSLGIVRKQVARVRRRLIAQAAIQRLAKAWAISLLVTLAWLLVEPYVLDQAPGWLRWAILGGATAIMTVIAIVTTIRHAPTATEAALTLDQRFDLRERAVTSLSLSPDQVAMPAGQALIADAETRIKTLHVREQFAVGLPWTSVLVPASALAVALVALFYHPTFSTAQGEPTSPAQNAAVKKEIDKKLDELAKKPRTADRLTDRPKSEELKRLEARLDEIAKKPRDNTQQLRDRIKDMTPLEEEIKKLERERTEKARMLQQQLQAKDKMMPNEAPKDGPAKDFSKALSEGDLEKAKEQLDKLAKKLEKNELSEKEKEQFGKQLDDLAKKMERLAEQKDKQEQLKQLAKEGKLDPETLQRELDKIKKDNEKLKDLNKLAQKLGQCQKCMNQGDTGQAAKNLADAAKQLGDMDLDEKELEDLKDQLDRLKSAQQSLCKACEGDGQCEGQIPGMGDFKNGRQEGAMGRRPDGEQGKIRSFDARQQAQFQPKGQKVFDGYAPGQAFIRKQGVELTGEIQQAMQQAPDAIEVQRIPKAAREMAKGYFRNLGGQKDEPKVQPKEQPKP